MSNLAVKERSVSIQLIFPASGNNQTIGVINHNGKSFHSIDFPSEWERRKSDANEQGFKQFPFN